MARKKQGIKKEILPDIDTIERELNAAHEVFMKAKKNLIKWQKIKNKYNIQNQIK